MNFKDNRLKFGAIGAMTFVLLSGNVFYMVENGNIKDQNQKQGKEINLLSENKSQLQLQLKSLTDEINVSREKNKELNVLLSNTNVEIDKKAASIAILMKENASLKEISREVKELRLLKERYIILSKDLQAKVEMLSAENLSLKSQNKDLNTAMERLTGRNSELEKKVEIASALKADNFIVEIEKKAKGGKYVKAKKSAKADRLAISFDLPENKIAAAGIKNIYAVIAAPDNKILPAKGAESGTFNNAQDHVVAQYTLMKEVDYRNSKQKVYMYYNIEHDALVKGNYKVQFFCDGLFCGAATFAVK